MKREQERINAACEYGGIYSLKPLPKSLAYPHFLEGAEWADKTLIEKTISWFYKNAHKEKYWDKDGCLLITVLMNDYRQAMEE